MNQRRTDVNMEYHLTGTVIGGALRLDTPVPLPDGTRVRVTIRLLDEQAQSRVTQTQLQAPVESTIERADEKSGNPTDS